MKLTITTVCIMIAIALYVASMPMSTASATTTVLQRVTSVASTPATQLPSKPNPTETPKPVGYPAPTPYNAYPAPATKPRKDNSKQEKQRCEDIGVGVICW